MKRILFVFIAAFCTMIVSAQSTTSTTKSSYALEKKIRFGFKIDLGSSGLHPKENYITKDANKFYFSYGFASDFLLTENYAISTGLNITTCGGSFYTTPGHGLNIKNSNRDITPNNYKISLHYLEIPFGLKLRTDDIKGLRYWGQFGTYLGINIGARTNATIGGATFDKENITSTTVPINMGLDLGAGIEIPINRKTYGSVGLGFRNGFIDITKQKEWTDGKTILNAFFLRTAIYF